MADPAVPPASPDLDKIWFRLRLHSLRLEVSMLADASAELSAAYVTGSVAALAIIGSIVTTWLTLRHQRTLAQDERLASQRADAYIRLIEYQRIDPGFSNLLPAEVASRLLAYGSEEVNRALQRVREATSQSTKASNEAIDGMIAQVRFELQGKKDQERLNTATRWQHS
jgi:hypothetical protein